MALIRTFSISFAVMLLFSWNTYISRNLKNEEEVLPARERRKRRAAEIISNTKPIMHTFVDRDQPYVDEELLALWSDAWTIAGWDIKILTINDAKKHPEYANYAKQLDDANICCLPRETYLRHIAMGAVPENGGFYSEIFVVPLHRLTDISDGESIIMGELPNNGEMTSYDGVIGTVLSGTKEEWNRVTTALMLMLERNVAISLQKIYFGNITKFNFNSDEMYGNFFFFLQDVCAKSIDKFVIRFHEHDLAEWGFEQYTRTFVVKKWFERYRELCWIEETGDRKLLEVINDSTQS